MVLFNVFTNFLKVWVRLRHLNPLLAFAFNLFQSHAIAAEELHCASENEWKCKWQGMSYYWENSVVESWKCLGELRLGMWTTLWKPPCYQNEGIKVFPHPFWENLVTKALSIQEKGEASFCQLLTLMAMRMYRHVGWGCSSVVGYLTTIHKGLDSISSTNKQNIGIKNIEFEEC